MLFVENIDNLPPLHSAAFLGDLKAIQAAIDAGAKISE
jgi:ankyrin repeat protein